jgi:hypothetical protein
MRIHDGDIVVAAHQGFRQVHAYFSVSGYYDIHFTSLYKSANVGN